MYAAAEKNLPIIVPGWEDSTMGNIFASYNKRVESLYNEIRYRIHDFLAGWYENSSKDWFLPNWWRYRRRFPICVVPMLYQDMEMHDIPFWSYFCQISDSTTSYGSYSGAVPNEKNYLGN
jgi:deoxyhypusine synthase